MNLNAMTVPQLREIAADLEIFGRSKMKKADLIAAIEYAEAPSADNIPGGIDDLAAAVARMRANREAEEEERATARRARNRTNYAPAAEIAAEAAYIEEGIEIDEADADEIDFNTLPDPDGSNTLPVPDGPWFEIGNIVTEQSDAAEQPDRASYYSGTVPCFERTTVDGIGYGCVKLGEHVEHNTALGATWWTSVERVAITKYSAHEAIATAAFEGRSVGGHVTRERGRWVLHVEGRTIRAKTLGKVAKLWAKALGFHATAIDIDVMN